MENPRSYSSLTRLGLALTAFAVLVPAFGVSADQGACPDDTFNPEQTAAAFDAAKNFTPKYEFTDEELEALGNNIDFIICYLEQADKDAADLQRKARRIGLVTWQPQDLDRAEAESGVLATDIYGFFQKTGQDLGIHVVIDGSIYASSEAFIEAVTEAKVDEEAEDVLEEIPPIEPKRNPIVRREQLIAALSLYIDRLESLRVNMENLLAKLKKIQKKQAKAEQ